MKSNAYSILASLGPHMEPTQLGQLFERLKVGRCGGEGPRCISLHAARRVCHLPAGSGLAR